MFLYNLRFVIITLKHLPLQLNIFVCIYLFVDKATIDVHPKAGYEIESKNYSGKPLLFNCSVTLDTKAAVTNGRPEMCWKTDLPELKDEKITQSNEDYGVRVSNDPQSIYHQHFTSAQLISNWCVGKVPCSTRLIIL